MYGRELPNQNGAPLRLVVPWKYGFKSIKSIVRISLVDEQPKTTWQSIAPDEYGFYANVNPRSTIHAGHRLVSGACRVACSSPMCVIRRCSMATLMKWRLYIAGSICGRTTDAVSALACRCLYCRVDVALFWLYQAWTDVLGPDPGSIGRPFGLGDLVLLLITLSMTPLQKFTGWAGGLRVGGNWVCGVLLM
jgi:hypothetical protein